jgi:pre-mRNA-splicing factor RBM22/SLT11
MAPCAPPTTLPLLPPTAAQIPNGGACHISGRPYTVFRWRPGNDARYKKTIICQEVAKAKNVCQVSARRAVGRRRSRAFRARGAALGAHVAAAPNSPPARPSSPSPGVPV